MTSGSGMVCAAVSCRANVDERKASVRVNSRQECPEVLRGRGAGAVRWSSNGVLPNRDGCNQKRVEAGSRSQPARLVTRNGGVDGTGPGVNATGQRLRLFEALLT